jgi:hypothetical protein
LSLELHLGDGFSVAEVEFVLYGIRIFERRKIKKQLGHRVLHDGCWLIDLGNSTLIASA